MQTTVLQTDRLLLRQWKPQDLAPFARLNADPEVMRYFVNPLNREQSDALAQRCISLIEENGWGFWALELRETAQFLGFSGLHSPEYALPFSPCIEIGWRLAKEYWGHGYATEAANRVLTFAFETLQITQVVSFTSLLNTRSQSVMQRVGMVNAGQNFKHPLLPEEHPLAEHVLYKKTRQQT